MPEIKGFSHERNTLMAMRFGCVSNGERSEISGNIVHNNNTEKGLGIAKLNALFVGFIEQKNK